MGGAADLLRQLAAGGRHRILPRGVEQSGGQFPQPAPHRVPVLVDHHHRGVVVQWQDRHRPGMFNDLAPRHPPTGHHDLVQPQHENPADVHGLAIGHGELMR